MALQGLVYATVFKAHKTVSFDAGLDFAKGFFDNRRWLRRGFCHWLRQCSVCFKRASDCHNQIMQFSHAHKRRMLTDMRGDNRTNWVHFEFTHGQNSYNVCSVES